MAERKTQPSCLYNPEWFLEQINKGCTLNDEEIIHNTLKLSAHLIDKGKNLKAEPDSTLRIALVIPYHPLQEVGGLEIGTCQIASSMTDAGHNVEIISKGIYRDANFEGEKRTTEGIKVIGIGSGIEEIGPFLIRNHDKYDVVQWMEVFPPVPEEQQVYNDKAQQQYVTSTILRSLGVDVYMYVATSGNVTNRGVDNPNWKTPIENQILNKLIVGANNGFNFANPQIADEYIKTGLHIPENRMQFIPFGVDTQQFKPLSPEEKIIARNKFEIPQDKFIFLYTGRFVSRKKADLLLSAWKSLSECVAEKCHLVLAGGAAAIGQPDSIYEQVVSQINKDSITNIDLVDHNEMPKLMGSCDSFVFPSEREGWPLVMCEAMASGLPVIGSNIDGVRDIVTPETGLLFSPNNVEHLVKKMTDIYTLDEGERKNMAIKSRETAINNWGWDNITRAYINFYRR